MTASDTNSHQHNGNQLDWKIFANPSSHLNDSRLLRSNILRTGSTLCFYGRAVGKTTIADKALEAPVFRSVARTDARNILRQGAPIPLFRSKQVEVARPVFNHRVFTFIGNYRYKHLVILIVPHRKEKSSANINEKNEV